MRSQGGRGSEQLLARARRSEADDYLFTERIPPSGYREPEAAPTGTASPIRFRSSGLSLISRALTSSST
jgi:hypothetical protein